MSTVSLTATDTDRPDAAVPLCAARPAHWDLDADGVDENGLEATIRTWQSAITACRACPMLQHCRAQAEREQPKDMIWAGVAYGDSGQPIDSLRAYAARKATATRSKRARPVTITVRHDVLPHPADALPAQPLGITTRRVVTRRQSGTSR